MYNIKNALLMFGNSLKMTKIDQNTSELWQIVCKKYNFNISAFVCFSVWIFLIISICAICLSILCNTFCHVHYF